MDNKILNAIKTRRSVKNYKYTPVKKDDIDKIIEAGLYAPNGMNEQSSIIISISDKETRDLLSKLNADVMGSSIDPFYNAPNVICVLADRSRSTAIEDGSLTLGNMFLAAHSLGIASCWIHRAREVFDSSEGKALLKKWGVNGNYMGVGFCILGYADGEKKATNRKEGRVYYVK